MGFAWKHPFWQQPIGLWDDTFDVGVSSSYAASVYAARMIPFVGRAIAALAADPDVLERSGSVLVAAALVREYGFMGIDGTLPEPYDGL